MAEIALPTYQQVQQINNNLALMDEDLWRINNKIDRLYSDIHTRRSVFSTETYLFYGFNSNNPGEVFDVGSSDGGIFGGISKLSNDSYMVNVVLEVDGYEAEMFRIGGNLSSAFFTPVPFESYIKVWAYSDASSTNVPLSVFVYA